MSKACVEPQSVAGGGGLTSVYLEKEGGAEEFLLCNLSSKETNVNLDLNFGYGEKVCFRTSGQGCVHLSGYLHQDESQQGGWESDDSDEEEEMSPDDKISSLLKLSLYLLTSLKEERRAPI